MQVCSILKIHDITHDANFSQLFYVCLKPGLEFFAFYFIHMDGKE